MSQENVEVVRSIYAAWSRGDSAGPFMDSDIEYVNPPDAVETGTLHGPKSFARLGDTYDDVRFRTERFIDAGDEVVVIAILSGTSHGARVPVERKQGYVWTIRDGKAIRFRWFNTARKALAAVGLSE